MVCDTLRVGHECSFMTKAGCTYNGGECYTIVDECEGCNKILEINGHRFCASYPEPRLKWKWGACNFASHITKEAKHEVRLNPLKASKRAAGRR